MVQQGIEGIKVLGGGVIPRADVQVLKDLGVAQGFRGGPSFDDIIQAIRNIVRGAQRQSCLRREDQNEVKRIPFGKVYPEGSGNRRR